VTSRNSRASGSAPPRCRAAASPTVVISRVPVEVVDDDVTDDG
jgi:hypothetical protein